MEFQINTRLLPRSVTKRRCPSDVTETGLNRLLAVGGIVLAVAGGAVVKFGSPSTTSAGWLLDVGILFQIITRLLSVSATNRRDPCTQTACGPRNEELESPIAALVKSACPSTMSAG